jgi:LPXTG-motif cell wall-anchored protein
MCKKILIALGCLALFLALPTFADQWNKKTVMTFNQPVELPGVVLPAGTYVFKLADSFTDRHIVQVFNEDETQIYAMILAIPNYRMTRTADTVVRFEERPRSNPEAIRAWFYPGDNFGQEFVYPRARAIQLAEATNQPVLTAEVTPTEPAEELAKAPVVAITPEEKEVQIAQVTEPVATPAPQVEAAAPAAEVAEMPAELPKTASEMPLLLVIGLCLLASAVLIRAYAKDAA